MSTTAKESGLIVTPKFRVSFPSVFKPVAFEEGAEPKYELTMIFEPGTDLSVLKAAATKAAINKFGEEQVAKLMKAGKLKSPFHSGEEKDLDGYDDDCTWINTSCKKKPDIIHGDKSPLEVESDFYGGCYARATVVAYAYDNKSKGVAFGLRNIQKIADGEPFSGGTTAADDFDVVEDYEPNGAAGGDAAELF